MAPPSCRHPRHLRNQVSSVWPRRRRHCRPLSASITRWRQQP
nr:MAG TPA: hypothetical protein [Caudoviricetes sp.]